MKVPLLDLTAQYEQLKDQIEPAVLKQMAAQAFVLGPTVENFENNIARYCQVKHAIGMSSGTDALLCALMAFDIGPGDEVIVPTFTFFATAGVVARLGATPVFADIDPLTYNISPDSLADKITDNTRAIIPVHLYGQMAPMTEIMDIARKYELKVIEDACQSIGARQFGQCTGEFGDCSALSFYPSKNLSGFGDGGMLLCQDDELARKFRYLRMHGEDKRYYHSMVGGNFRLDALQAVVLDIKLKYLDSWAAGRQKNAALYDELLAGVTQVRTPFIARDNVSVYNQYVIRAERRDELKEFLTAQQIGNNIYYPVPLHLQECFSTLGGKSGDCPVAEQACKEVLALPVYPELSPEQIRFVADQIKEFYKK
ncbi:MAG: DegT/DnrJ/EryC1/StrS family aminotransferase [Sedimentisphaerales bacterium]|nr:DegT/DnrJ/EryC1/StrS family aminotransferase [Sedimentisphaerales bacterium]